jgi:predicted nucleic acid-binding protein
MLGNRRVVIDTTALVYFTHLQKNFDIFGYLRLIFQQILIPSTVKTEYEIGLAKQPERNWLLQKLKPNQGFYTLCTRYDSIQLAFLATTKGIHSGEAETAAQYQKAGARYIISDDKDFSKAVQKIYPHCAVISSLHVIAMLEFNGTVKKCDKLKLELHAIRPFNSAQLRAAYAEVAKELGLNITKKEMSQKTSLSKIRKR